MVSWFSRHLSWSLNGPYPLGVPGLIVPTSHGLLVALRVLWSSPHFSWSLGWLKPTGVFMVFSSHDIFCLLA